jgi:hypothetical protein
MTSSPSGQTFPRAATRREVFHKRSRQPERHHRDSHERPLDHNIGDRRHESARRHRRVYAEMLQRLRDQESAECARNEVGQHRERDHGTKSGLSGALQSLARLVLLLAEPNLIRGSSLMESAPAPGKEHGLFSLSSRYCGKEFPDAMVSHGDRGNCVGAPADEKDFDYGRDRGNILPAVRRKCPGAAW